MDNKQIVWKITRIVSGVIISIIALGAFTDSIVGGAIGLIGAALTFLPLNKKIPAFKGRQIVFIALPAVCLTVACILSPIVLKVMCHILHLQLQKFPALLTLR